MEIGKQDLDELLIEGKTKKVFSLKSDAELVLVVSKDRITAGDGLKSHEMEGKARLSTQTNCAVFQFLSAAGIPTHFVSRVKGEDADRAFVARKCAMVPIEWVTRRVATGSYLKRHPNVKEGHRFAPPKLETFLKDDANHDPFWSLESLICAELEVGGRVVGEKEVEEMLAITRLVFEAVERVWQTVDHSLIDMKIEFGITGDQQIVVADVIDNDSWRLWPKGDKRQMLDKQLYRNLDVKDIDANAIQTVRQSFEIVAQRTQQLFTAVLPKAEIGIPTVAIVLGSDSDRAFAERIAASLREKFAINDVSIVVSSAHKATPRTLRVAAELEQWSQLKVIVAVAGLSNGLGPVIAGNVSVPVINCPPIERLEALPLDIWSSLRMPSGMAVTTVLGAENAAQSAAAVVGSGDAMVWTKIRTQQTLNSIKFFK